MFYRIDIYISSLGGHCLKAREDAEIGGRRGGKKPCGKFFPLRTYEKWRC
jgi:hypothetical protein